MKKLTSLFVLVSILTSTALFGQVKFQYVDFDYAKSTALKTQKPFFVYFAANDCNACWQMNTATFKDLDLATAISGNINAYKVDIKSKSGDKWAMKFAIYEAPVFIFFDENGNMTQRVEHPLTASELKNLAANPSSYHEMKSEFAALKENSSTVEASTAETVGYSASEDYSTETSTDYAETTETTSEEASWVSTETVPASETTYGLFAVQTGIFTNENYAERMAKELSNNYSYSINVRTEVIDGKTFHRVLLGDFADEKSAKSVYQILKSDGRKAFVRAK